MDERVNGSKLPQSYFSTEEAIFYGYTPKQILQLWEDVKPKVINENLKIEIIYGTK